MVQFSFVLILVLVEDGLGDLNKHLEKIRRLKSLNPCFSGGWSRRWTSFSERYPIRIVLILVLVEDGLGV